MKQARLPRKQVRQPMMAAYDVIYIGGLLGGRQVNGRGCLAFFSRNSDALFFQTLNWKVVQNIYLF